MLKIVVAFVDCCGFDGYFHVLFLRELTQGNIIGSLVHYNVEL